jgi:glucoamylase
LCCSLRHKKVFDLPLHTQERYIQNKTEADWEVWRFEHPCITISKSKYLRIEVLTPAVVYWSINGWATINETTTYDSTLGMHLVNLPTKTFGEGEILFTFYWLDSKCWENNDFKITIVNE